MIWANAGLVFTVIAWGSTAPVINELLKTWDPLVLTAARSLLTAPLFLIWLAIAEGRAGLALGVPRRPVVILGAMLAAFALLYTLGIRFANPITVAIISSAGPVVAGIVDWLLNGRRMPGRVMVAVPFAVAGGILATVDFASAGNVFHLEGGEPLIAVAIVVWTLYSSLIQRWLPGETQLRRTAMTFLGSAPFLIAAAAVSLALGIEALPERSPDAFGWALFLWTSLGISIFGTLLWNVGVHHVGIVVAAMFLNLLSVVAVLVSMMFGIEPRPEQLLGGLVVISAVALAQFRAPGGKAAGRRGRNR